MILEDVDSFPSFQKKRKKDRKRKLIQDHLLGFVHTYMYVFKKIRFRVSTRIVRKFADLDPVHADID